MSARTPTASIAIRERGGEAFFEAMFRHDGKQLKRRIGPAWLERDDNGGWRARHGRVPDGCYDERRAHAAAARIVSDYVTEAGEIERIEHERRSRGVTFREVAQRYLSWLEDVKGAKPSTLADYRYLLAEPGVPYKRRAGESAGHIMERLGDLSAAKVSVRDVDTLLATVSKAGRSPRNVNKHRALVSAIFNYGMKDSAFSLPRNPAALTDKRKEAQPGVLVFYTPEEVEALARALADGRHREKPAKNPVKVAEDAQDAELVRVAAYAGLRLGELLALRWSDVDFAGHAVTVARAMSLGVESSPKSGRVRRIPLPDQAAVALDRLSRREHFTTRGDRVFCNVLGRMLDGSAVRKRFKRARDAAGLRPLRFHDLRHTYGSLLAAAGIDLVSIQAVMGHSALSTTSRYLHARPASEQAEAFTRAFEPGSMSSGDALNSPA
ncbi:MAG: site-specific integrase [Actinobacteria bacterium]|nr:MAG: site-specific integrase [Actinomycetota bacterium]